MSTGTTMSVVHCHICCDDKCLEDIRVLRCGHCFCVVCTDELKSRRSTCPVCRRAIRAKDGGPIFITFADTKVAKAKCIIDDLYNMDEDTKEESVVKAGDRIKKVLEESTEAESDVLHLLWDAVEDFKTRIAAFYATSNEQTAKITTLEKALSCAHRENVELKQSIRQAKSLESEHKKLQLRVKDAERQTEAAVTLAERGRDDAVKLREEVAGLRKITAYQRTAKEEMDKENKQLKVWLDQHNRIRRVRREKLAALQEKVTRLEKGADPVDDSLMIVDDAEPASKCIQPPISVSRWPAGSACSPTSRSDLFASADGPPSSFPHVLTSPQNQRYNDFECLPGPRPFKSPWSTSHQVHSGAQKRKFGVGSSFPIDLDKSGHVKGSVQLGPKRRLFV